MKQSNQPLAEVFGHLVTDQSASANRYRSCRLCPFNNRVPNCTKDKAKNPLGVCSIMHDGNPVITCPIRFREDWIITCDAASFFFPKNSTWSSLTELRLNDANNKSAGNIDVVLVAYDKKGRVLDFGFLEIQAVYISGNVREPFEYFMGDPKTRAQMNWEDKPSYPRPDYLSSSRKRLAPQLLFKGGIINSWNKKIAVALNRSFFETLPDLTKVSKNKADMALFVYDLLPFTIDGQQQYKLTKIDEMFTKFTPALLSITTPVPGKVNDFVKLLQERLDEQLELPPNNRTIEKPF